MFKRNPLFIVFEGLEGCSKSFQAKKLLYNLKKKNKSYTYKRTWWHQKLRINKKFIFKRLF